MKIISYRFYQVQVWNRCCIRIKNRALCARFPDSTTIKLVIMSTDSNFQHLHRVTEDHVVGVVQRFFHRTFSPTEWQQAARRHLHLRFCKFVFDWLDTTGKGNTHHTLPGTVNVQFRIHWQPKLMLLDVGHRIVGCHITEVVQFCLFASAWGLLSLHNPFITFHQNHLF